MPAAALPELMPELLPVSEGVRRGLPRWDPRLWGGHEVLEAEQVRRLRTGAELRRVGLGWARAHAQARRGQQSLAPTPAAGEDATPPCHAQQAQDVRNRKDSALASMALGGVGGPQAAAPRTALITPPSDAAEDRRRWARPHATSELVEARTYQPYGATESDYRPERWKGFREDYGFTGKEEDIEVGLQYFGKRYLSPYLGRWISADPLAIHSPEEADWNLYAYVSGQAFRLIDPLGLCGQEGTGGACSEAGTAGTDTQTNRSEPEQANDESAQAAAAGENEARSKAWSEGFKNGLAEGARGYLRDVERSRGLHPQEPNSDAAAADAKKACGQACETYKEEFESGREWGEDVGYQGARTTHQVAQSRRRGMTGPPVLRAKPTKPPLRAQTTPAPEDAPATG